jgi:DegV family protein with EDD domain
VLFINLFLIERIYYMNKIAIVTDSTANLPPDLVTKYNISVAPLVLIWGDKTYQDGIDIKPADFYQALPQSKVLPTTSQATVKTFIDIFKKLTQQGYDILTIVISSKLSGTLDSAIQAKQEFPQANIELIDSLSTSVPLSMLVLMAARAVKKGASLQQVKDLMERAKKHVTVFFAVETLEYLHKGGRIGGAARFLGTALGLKPILVLRDGSIDALEKIRTTKKAQARLIELLEQNLDKTQTINGIGIIDADAADGADYLKNECMERFNPQEVFLGTLSPVIGAHTGPGTVGVAVIAGMDDDLIK